MKIRKAIILWIAQVLRVTVHPVVMCPACGGDGKETCNNPDHGFIHGALGSTDTGRLGCPVCGHSEDHKVPNGGDCFTCNGSGKVTKKVLLDWEKGMDT